ncbi:hypothetical protein F2Q69_00021102 [Brassica cretica]|uniref:Uncharacterized protein n=1 Tax=Brassica cretica TaxID=69181 RepID=A0A8S9QIX9_BRACR|nr:hypothetical protein F2Q69_00021102 [Brassica cretica]
MCLGDQAFCVTGGRWVLTYLVKYFRRDGRLKSRLRGVASCCKSMKSRREEAETTIEPPLEDVKNDEGGDVAAEEASHKTNSASATPSTCSTPEAEEMKKNQQSPSRTTHIADKAKEKEALRQAGVATL